MRDVQFDKEDACGEHYHVQIEVDRCDGFHGAVGVNIRASTVSMLEGFSTLLMATAKTDEERAMAASMTEMLKMAFASSKKDKPGSSGKVTRDRHGQKVVPIRPAAERGPFAVPHVAGTIKRCQIIEGPHIDPGWVCCACAKKHPQGMGTYNGLQRDVCKVCQHTHCMSAKTLRDARKL